MHGISTFWGRLWTSTRDTYSVACKLTGWFLWLSSTEGVPCSGMFNSDHTRNFFLSLWHHLQRFQLTNILHAVVCGNAIFNGVSNVSSRGRPFPNRPHLDEMELDPDRVWHEGGNSRSYCQARPAPLGSMFNPDKQLCVSVHVAWRRSLRILHIIMAVLRSWSAMICGLAWPDWPRCELQVNNACSWIRQLPMFGSRSRNPQFIPLNALTKSFCSPKYREVTTSKHFSHKLSNNSLKREKRKMFCWFEATFFVLEITKKIASSWRPILKYHCVTRSKYLLYFTTRAKLYFPEKIFQFFLRKVIGI